jgi:hypothetical protein
MDGSPKPGLQVLKRTAVRRSKCWWSPSINMSIRSTSSNRKRMTNACCERITVWKPMRLFEGS